MIWNIVIAAIWLFCMLCLRNRKQKRKALEKKWDPFGFKQKFITRIKCSECGKIIYRDWQKGDYMMKEVYITCVNSCKDGNCETCNKKCKAVIEGIFIEKELSKKEQKYEALCEKWR